VTVAGTAGTVGPARSRRILLSRPIPIPSRARAARPSSHQWLPVAATATMVITRWASSRRFHGRGAVAYTPSDTTAAHATWIDGIAAN